MQIYAVNYFWLSPILAKRFQICNGDIIGLNKVCREREDIIQDYFFYSFLFICIDSIKEICIFSFCNIPKVADIVVCGSEESS